MSDEDLSKQLQGYLNTLSGGAIESIAEREYPATGPFGESSRKELSNAKTGVQKLAQGKMLTRNESAAVEAIVLTTERPVIDVLNNDFTVSDPIWGHLASDEISHRHITNALPLIGRIEIPKMPSRRYAGTGFLVGPNLLMTNRHVAELFTLGEGVQQLRFKAGQVAGVDFKRETKEDATHMLDLVSLEMVHPFWDMALFKVRGLPAGHPHLTLDPIDPADTVGREVAIIGYPAFDDRNNINLQLKIFNSKFDIKRIQPGKMRARAEIESYGMMVQASAHDASTLGGNSGSAVIDLETGHVIGLHFAGLYLKSNYAVPAADLGLDGRVVDAGVAFTRNVQVSPTPWAGSWAAADATESVAVGTGSGGARSLQVAASAGGTGSVTIPLTITVAFGES